jgi:predicted phosphodiesterase
VDLLAGLPHPVIRDVRGFGLVAFCHGTPRDDNEVVLVDTRLERWAEAFAGLPGEVRTVVCGHTHMPFARLVDRRLVVNPGSVGMPYGRAGGHWALLKDGGVSLHRVEIDVEAAIAAVVADSAYPDRAAWAEDYLRATASDADAVAAARSAAGAMPAALLARYARLALRHGHRDNGGPAVGRARG